MSFEAVQYDLVLAQSFQESLARLAPENQAAVTDTVGKLQRGLDVRMHTLESVKWVSIYVNKKAIRVICHRDGRTLVLCWVDFHDEAYAWATRNAFRQLGHVIRIARVHIDDEAAATASAPSADLAPPGPFAAVKDKSFRAIEISPDLARALRALPHDDALLELCAHLDPPLGEALVALASDPDALADVVATYRAAKERAASGAPVGLADALRADVNAQTLWVAPPEQRALEEALRSDSATWRVFLHPSQKRLVHLNASGPYLVSGGPGTGKTVVALHRARVLAERNPGKPVLVTTFSRVLTAQLEDGVRMVCRDAPAVGERIEVRTLVEAARRVLTLANEPNALLVREDIDAAWAELLRDSAGRGQAFYASEREEVLLARGVTTEDEYLKVGRAGRGERLDRAAKRDVWAVLQRFEAALARRGGDDDSGLARRATALLRAGRVQSPYAAVVCDEVQDASPHQLRLLAALAPVELFLVGDGHQRLYQRPTSLRACGIEVRGRSARLRLNYRTTQGICAAALDALTGLEPDVLDVEDAGGDPDGYRSVRAGERPQRHTFATDEQETEFIAQHIRETTARPFLVLARTRRALSALADRLRARGVTCAQLEDADAMPTGDHVVLATLHRSKGLEAPRVILASMQDVPARFPGGSDEDKAAWLKRERLLVYVGMTRARDWCALTNVAG